MGILGKAYGLAVAAERLETAGAPRFRLTHGPLQILSLDAARFWRVDLPHGPGDPPRSQRALRLRGGAVSVLDFTAGEQQPPLIDPRSGDPLITFRYALVLSADPVQSAALVQVLAVLGRHKGLELIEALPGVEALVIGGAGYVHATVGLRAHVLRRPLGAEAASQ